MLSLSDSYLLIGNAMPQVGLSVKLIRYNHLVLKLNISE
jgi:hypothetical protein